MNTAIAYEVFQGMKVYIFEDLLIFHALYYKYIANIIFKQFTKWCFTVWFHNFIKKIKKKKKKKNKTVPF